MNTRTLIPVVAALAVLLLIPEATAQTAPLTLPKAVAIAMESNPARKIARADSDAAKAQVALSTSAFLPQIGFSETATIGNDPVYAFGTRLRQGRFTQQDFALNRLNHPEPIGNFASQVSGRWNLFNTFSNTFHLRGARLMEQSSAQQLSRAEQEVIFRVVDAYYGVALAQKQVELAQQTLKTAEAMLDASSARVAAGSAVASDELSANVNVANRKQELIQSQNAVQIALTQLETALGATLAPGQQPAALLKEQTMTTASLEETEALALKQRPDLRATALHSDAQQQGVKAAKAAYGPRLDVFGSWQADNPSFASGGNSNWTAAAELRIELFSRDREAQVSLQKAILSRTQAANRMAEDNVRLEVRRAWFDHDASRQMLDVSRASVRHAAESLRIMRDRYETGLVTITDLLRAEDADRASRTNYWQAVYRYLVSYAALQLSSGDLTAQSTVVNQ